MNFAIHCVSKWRKNAENVAKTDWKFSPIAVSFFRFIFCFPAQLRPILFLAFTLVPGLSFGNTPLSFQDSVRKSLQDNPGLLKSRYEAESLKHQAENAMSPNNPQLFFTKHNSTEFSPNSRGASDEVGLNYTLNFPGKSIAKSRSFDFQAKAGMASSHQAELDTILAVSNSFIEYDLGLKLEALLQKSIQQSLALIGILEKKYKMGEANQVDLLNLKSQNAELKLQALVRQNENRQSLIRYRGLIRAPLSDFVPLIETGLNAPEFKKTEEELVEIAFKNNHELQATQLNAESRQSTLTASRLSPLPDFTLSASIQVYNEPNSQPNPGLSRDYNLGVSFAVPLFFPFNESPLIQSARKDLMAAEFEVEKKKLDLRASVHQIFSDFTATNSQVQNLLEDVLPLSKASYELSLRAYTNGRADYLRLKDARTAYFEAEKSLITAQSQAAKTFQNLISLLGCDFTARSPMYVCN